LVFHDPEWLCVGVTEIASECGFSRRAFHYQRANGRLRWLEHNGLSYLAVAQSCWAHTSATGTVNATIWTQNGQCPPGPGRRPRGRPVTTVCSAGTNAQAVGNLSTLASGSLVK
jgi:hypothetical protein